jgi:hypothetical protein
MQRRLQKVLEERKKPWTIKARLRYLAESDAASGMGVQLFSYDWAYPLLLGPRAPDGPVDYSGIVAEVMNQIFTQPNHMLWTVMDQAWKRARRPVWSCRISSEPCPTANDPISGEVPEYKFSNGVNLEQDFMTGELTLVLVLLPQCPTLCLSSIMTFSTIDKEFDKREGLGPIVGPRICCVCGLTETTLFPRTKMLSCGDCRAQHYCSIICQRAAWTTHKNHCKKNH